MAKNVKSFFDKDAQKPAMLGAVGGLGLFIGVEYLAPSFFQSITASIASVFSSILGASIGSFLGYMLPLVATVLVGAFLSMQLAPAPEPASQKGMKAGKEFLRNTLARFIPGGRDTVDAMEDIAEIGIDLAKNTR